MEKQQEIIDSFYQNIDSLLDVQSGNQNQALENLILTYKIRHDIIHHIFVTASGLPDNLRIEKKVSFYLPLMTSKLSNLTPDIILCMDNTSKVTTDIKRTRFVKIVDFSVSSNSNLQIEKKRQKYEPLLNHLQDFYPTIDFSMHVCFVSPDFSDLEHRYSEFCQFINIELTNPVDFLGLRFFSNKVKNSQIQLKAFIQDERLVSEYFEEEFGDGAANLEEHVNADSDLNGRIDTMFENNKLNCSRNTVLKEHALFCLDRINRIQGMDKDLRDKMFEDKFQRKCLIFKELLEDEEIYSTFSEKPTSTIKIQKSIDNIKLANNNYPESFSKPIHQLYTPILTGKHLNLNEMTYIDNSLLNRLRLEQRQIVSMLSMFRSLTKDELSVTFVKELASEILESLTNDHSEFNISSFNSGIYKNEKEDKNWKFHYNNYKVRCIENHTPIRSFVDFLRDNGEKVPQNKDARGYRQKMFKIPMGCRTSEFTEFWKKGHSGYKKEKKVSTTKRTTCSFDDVSEIDDILDLFSEKLPLGNIPKDYYSPFFNRIPSDDEHVLKDLKDKMVREFQPLIQELRHFKGYKYLQTQSLVAEQMMHFNQFSLPSNTISFFTCGTENLLYIVNNSYHDKGKDVGKAFIVIGYTDDTRWFKKPFGKITYWPIQSDNKTYYMFCTNWRRIETYKVTFLKDQYFCVLSTAMNSMLRFRSEILDYDHIEDKDSYSREAVRHCFSLKLLISLTTNQKIAEMLADMRYAIMASFSEYSEIERLIVDKFSPPYNTSLEVWIASRMNNLKKQAHDFVTHDLRNTYFKQPVFYNGKRSEESIGGKFDIPSIWTGFIIHDLQDLLDDMFLYVHTLKEPSSIHHENVKAINTILEYQEKYEKLSSDRKRGLGHLIPMKEMLLDKSSNIGHNSDVLEVSVHRTMSTLKGVDWNVRLKKHFNEPISNITSTKAAIPEYERELVDSKDTTKKSKVRKLTNSMYIQEYARYNKISANSCPPKMLRTKISKESSLPDKNRSKVHDCILDVLEQNNYIATVFDMAEWNVNRNNSKTLADICIKAQYGAKREFYVINVGSKACARVLENMFEEICKQLPNEMISVPGDKKLLVMQDFLNAALSKKSSKERIYFVNGDCTKWSAAETMECFLSMLRGLSDHIEIGFIKYLMSVIMMWGNKDITIPISLLQNTFFITNEYTKYLETHTATLNSNQNFLQGMFNYMSSFKAVCSSNLTRDVWAIIRPESRLKMEHMEHSDDYSLILTIENEKDLEEFRTLHRIIMKCHGFNDSIKKTNTQQFLMEFISLVSLNGHMTYPHIKKLKECGMNLGCTGYRDDVDSAMSRVGEAVRVGSIMTSAYFMQRCHLANVSRSYSILDGQRNNIMLVRQLFNLPVELFGIPDTHPILSFLCKGMANNYRLLRFSKQTVHSFKVNGKTKKITNQQLLRNLLIIEKAEINDKDLISEVSFTEGVRFFHPRYSFDMENNLIKKIRGKVKIQFEECVDFWDKHKSYNFVKPKNKSLLTLWLKAMYFRHNFAMAYSRSSRAQITLRLSTYTSKDCCVVGMDSENNPIKTTIIEYIDQFINNHLQFSHLDNTIVSQFDLNEMIKASMNCDSTVSTVYSFFSESRVIEHGSHTRSTIATLTPTKINWLNIDNSPSTLIQYIFNVEDFKMDMRFHKGVASLNADKKVIENFYSQELGDKTELSIVKSVFTDMNLSQNRRNLCMSYSNTINTLEEFLSNHIEFGTIFRKRFQVVSAGVKEAINPHTGETYFRKMKTTTKNPYKAMIDDASLLYSVLRHSYKLDLKDVRAYLDDLHINDPNSEELNMFNFKDLMMLTLQDTRSFGFNTSEQKTFAFLKAFCTQNSQELSEIANDNLVYSYQYEKVEGQITKVFSECVRFNYQNSKFKSYRLFKTSQIIVISDVAQKHLLTDAYLISQKLFNIIKQSDLEKNISQTSLRSIMENKTISSMDELVDKEMMEYFVGMENIVSTLSMEGEKSFYSFKTPDFSKYKRHIFFHTNTMDKLSGLQDDMINKKISIDWEQNSVFVGNKKLFTLPVLGCVQSNNSYLLDDKMVNGLSINWWLQESRLKHFIHEEDLPVSREIYDSIGGYLIEHDNYLFSLSCVQKVNQLVLIPSVKMFLDQYDIAQKLNDRIKNKRYNDKNPQPEFEPDETKGKYSETIDWDKALSSIGFGGGKPLEFNIEEDIYDEESDTSQEPNMVENELGELDLSTLTKLIRNETQGVSSDFKIIERDDSSDNDEFEKEYIRDKSSGSSEENDPRYLSFNEFQKMIPKITSTDIVFTSGKSHSTQRLRRLGDPTHYLVKKGYADKSSVNSLKVKDRAAMLYKLKTIISLCDYLSDHELLLAVTLLNEIVASLDDRKEWPIKDDFVLYRNIDDNYDIFVKYIGVLDNNSKKNIKFKGGHCINNNEDHTKDYVLVPIPVEKKRDLLESLTDDIDVSRFMNIKPLERCYYRLFKEPFKRIGFASQLLAEFL